MANNVYLPISNGELQVNNTKIVYVPNSLSCNLGFSARDVKGLSAGIGATAISVSEDVSTNVGRVKFKIDSSPTNLALYASWQQAGVLGVPISILGSNDEGDFIIDYTNMVIISDSEVTLQHQGETEVEFKGNPAIYKVGK